MRYLMALILALLTFSVLACGDEESDDRASDEPPAAETEKAPEARQEQTGTSTLEDRCEKPPKAIAKALKDGLKHGTLTKLTGVKSEGEFDGPNSLDLGVYFVSGDVQPNPGIATWAVSADAWETGGGLIFAIGPAARAVSDFGVDVDPSMFGLDESAEGFEESQECVGS